MNPILNLSSSKISVTILKILSFATVSRFIDPNSFAIASLFLLVVNLSQIFTQSGVEQNVQKQLIITKAYVVKLVIWIIICSTISLLVSAVSYLFLSPNIHILQNTQTLAIIFFSILLFDAFSQLCKGLLAKEQEFKEIAFIELFSKGIFSSLILIILSIVLRNCFAIIIANLLASALASYLYIASVNQKLHICKTGGDSEVHKMSNIVYFWFNYVKVNLLAFGTQRIDNLIVYVLWGQSWYAIYVRAFNLVDIANSTLGSAIKSVVYSRLSNEIKNPSYSHSLMFKKVLRITIFCVLFGIASILAIVLLKEILVTFLLGKKWESAYPFLVIFSFGIFPRLASKSWATYILALNRPNLLILSNISYILILSTLALLSRHNIYIIALSSIISAYFYFLVNLLLSKHIVSRPLRL